MQVSKSFRAQFVDLSDAHVAMLQGWCAAHFALSTAFRGSHGRSVVLVALTDKPRTAASFARSLRGVLKRMAIPTLRAVRGHWVTLITAQEALNLRTGASDLRMPVAAPPAPAPAGDRAAAGDDKVVALHR